MTKKSKIKDRTHYEEVMNRIEKSLQKVTELGGLDKLPEKEVKTLQELSLMAEEYEDSIPLMPIKKPASINEMVRYKMFEMNIKQKQLAEILGISEARLSEFLSGKRKLTIELAKKLHLKLKIDAHFILEQA
jgi:HTH-type transcriptional regulator / antitoxin HigA